MTRSQENATVPNVQQTSCVIHSAYAVSALRNVESFSRTLDNNTFYFPWLLRVMECKIQLTQTALVCLQPFFFVGKGVAGYRLILEVYRTYAECTGNEGYGRACQEANQLQCRAVPHPEVEEG